MKISQILDVECDKDSRKARTNRVMRHAFKKRQTNPQPSRTDDMHNFWDVFGGIAGYSTDGENPIGPSRDF